MSSDDFITQSPEDDSTANNYVLISVPHGSDKFYYTRSADALPMTSFLRIGAVTGDDPTKEGGWEFAKLVVGFNDDTRKRPGDSDESDAGRTAVSNAIGTGVAFDVQEGMRAFYGADTTLSQDQALRVKESTRLHYRGGWRDHSAGNRISTTQGDKVELVRGNYKMVVLGRRPEKSKAQGDAATAKDYVETPVDILDNSIATFDVSGGHVQEWNMAPGQVTEITWVKNEGGKTDGAASPVSADTPAAYYTWKTVEESIKGDVESTHYGDVTETYLGPRVTRTIGWKDAPGEDSGERAPGDAGDDSIPPIFREYPGLSRAKPVVHEQTWAQEIETYRGSDDNRVHRLREETYASRITSHVHGHNIWMETHAHQYMEDIYADYHSTTFHGGDFRECWWGHFGELFLGACETFRIGGEFIDVRLAGKIVEMNVGLPLGVTEIKMSLTHVSEYVIAGWKTDVNMVTGRETFDSGMTTWISSTSAILTGVMFLC